MRIENLKKDRSTFGTAYGADRIAIRSPTNQRLGDHKFWDPRNSVWYLNEEENGSEKRVAIFIDNSYAFIESRRMGFRLDHRRLVNFLASRAFECFDLQCATLYCIIDPTASQQKLSQTKRIYRLFSTFPKFEVQVFDLKIKRNGEMPDLKYEKGVDVALTADLLMGAYQGLFDVAIVVAGDETYIPAVDCAQKMGRLVFLATFDDNTSIELQEIADATVSLTKTAEQICQLVDMQSPRPKINGNEYENQHNGISVGGNGQRYKLRYADQITMEG